MRELSVAEQRYQAVLAVISDGETVTDVASRSGVSRKTVRDWLAKRDRGHVLSESAVYRALVRLNLIDSTGRRRRDRKWKRWERGAPMEL